jgi:protein tyrosine phosphatase (PTP) superfamily phosphohydrolase (DUF442 family)
MNQRFPRLLGLTAFGFLAAAGCKHEFQRSACAPIPPPTAYSPYPPASLGPAGCQPAPQATLPPPQPPIPPAGDIRNYSPPQAMPAQPSWQVPTDGRVQLSIPQTPPPPIALEGARLQTPEFAPQSPPMPRAPDDTAAAPPANPSQVTPSQATPALPVGIPQYAVVQDQVASGLKPLLDGLDWLKDNGYRAVLHIRQPGEDDSADRRQIEKRGLYFLSLDVTPDNLTRATVDEFNRIVGTAANRPLFVYDRDGMLAGGLWYLHFRTTDRLNDETARAQASRLGLKEDARGEHRIMWLAIQKVLGEQSH